MRRVVGQAEELVAVAGVEDHDIRAEVVVRVAAMNRPSGEYDPCM